jgi:hypothetical protein
MRLRRRSDSETVSCLDVALVRELLAVWIASLLDVERFAVAALAQRAVAVVCAWEGRLA